MSLFTGSLQLLHMSCLSAWALRWFCIGSVQRCCTESELFSAFLPDYFYGNITRTTGKLAHAIVQGDCLMSWINEFVNRHQEREREKQTDRQRQTKTDRERWRERFQAKVQTVIRLPTRINLMHVS